MFLDDDATIASNVFKVLDGSESLAGVQVSLKLNMDESRAGICKNAASFAIMHFVSFVETGEFAASSGTNKMIQMHQLPRFGLIS